MALLVGGLAVTLWLSTAAAADSYRLDAARQQARTLSEQRDRLHREVADLAAAPALAAAARALGMVSAPEAARLVVGPDGPLLVGTPTVARAPAPPAPPPGPQPPAQQELTPPGATQPAPGAAPGGVG